MRAQAFTIGALVLLIAAGCAGAKVVRLRDPATGEIVKCSGSASLPEVVTVNQCIYDHKQAGYEIWR